MKNKIIHYLNAVVPPVLWAGVIFILSSQRTLPGVEVIASDFVLKKIAHILVYAVLYLLTHRGISMITNQNQTKLRLILPIIICLAYAVSDELHQTFIPNRFGTLRDVGYDMLGTGIVFLRKYRYI